MQQRKGKVNVICFWMLFSICLFTAFGLLFDVITDGAEVLLKPFAVRYVTLIFNMLCASVAILFADKNAGLYPIGATVGVLATETFLLNKAINALVTSGNTCEIIISALSFLAVLLLIVTIIAVYRQLAAKKTCSRRLNHFALAYMVIIACIAALNGYEKIFLDFDSVYAAVMMTLQYLLLINAPLTVFVLARQALCDRCIA